MKAVFFVVIKFILFCLSSFILFLSWPFILLIWKKGNSNKVYIKLMHYLYKFSFFPKFIYLNLEKINPDVNYIYISNHQSYFDLVILGYICQNNAFIIAKDVLKYLPYFGWLLYLSGNFFIKRGNSIQSKLMMDKVTAKIKAQKSSIYLYPQGTRVNQVAKLKKGFIHLAKDTQTDIQLYVVSSYKLSDILFNFRNKNPIYIKICDPISYTKPEAELLEEVKNLMNNTISELDNMSMKSSPILSYKMNKAS